MCATFTRVVYTKIVYKNITLTADEDLIKRARMRAIEQKTSLNVVFRQWLKRYASTAAPEEDYRRLMKQLKAVDSGGTFTRDEMNSR